MEDKEENKEKAKKRSFKFKKSTLWMGISILLGVLFIISIATGGFRNRDSSKTGKISMGNDEFIFMNSDGCTTACDEMEPIAKEYAKKAGLKFSKSKYFQPVRVPGFVLVTNGVVRVSAISDKVSLVKTLCDATGKQEVCDEIKELEEDALKEKCDKFKKEEKPEFKMFIMSFCPYGQEATKIVEPVVKEFGSEIDFEPHYVIYDKSLYAGSEDNYCEEDVCSMHGVQELHEDMRQKCIWKYENENYWDYIRCIISKCNSRNVDDCWNECSDNLDDINKIENCQEEEGVELMRAEKEEMAKFGVRGSESLILNGIRLEMQDYRWDPNKLKNLICCGFESRPDICGNKITGASVSSGPKSGSCG